MFRIPFRWTPASWGLTGDAYLEAEAHYTLEGAALERRLAHIRFADQPHLLERRLLEIALKHGEIDRYGYDKKLAMMEYPDSNDLAVRMLDIELKHGKIDDYTAATRKVHLTTEQGVDRDVALLDIDHEFGKIADHEYNKKRATLKKEPWIAIVNSGFDPEQGIDGVFFEFDWNGEWIEYLRTNGYTGHNDEQIVDEWFTDVCRSYAAADITTLPYPIAATRDE